MDTLPAAVEEWFAGRRAGPPWTALVYPSRVLVYERWAVWAREHPGAQPPAGFERIATIPARIDGTSFAEALRLAQDCAALGRRLGIES